jgi:biopolymer transport protein ExbD
MQGKKKNNRLPDINITPLVDVMLVLLVIFMAVAPSMHSDVEVRVPKVQYSSNKDAIKKEDLIKISIGNDNGLIKLFVNEKQVTENEIVNELTKFPKNLYILLKADKNLRYEQVYKILDLLKAAGYSNIALVGIQE